MLQRIEDWFAYFDIPQAEANRARELADRTLGPSAGMMALGDLHALGAALLHHRPKRIFEIGTYLGATSNFFLDLLPEAHVTSMAYIPAAQLSEEANIYDGHLVPRGEELGLDRVGSLVTPENSARFTQLIGDSHQIIARDFVVRHGAMDFILIDGDISPEGMAQDTTLARNLIAPSGAIAWHNANPKRKYIASRTYLEQTLPLTALATADNFVGGIALWTANLERRLLGDRAA